MTAPGVLASVLLNEHDVLTKRLPSDHDSGWRGPYICREEV
jgi:hypothetical protein